MMRLACLLLALAIGHAMDVQSSLSFDEEAAKNRPVTKVIKTLQDMLKTLQKEAEEDEDIYDKLACWCETNDREKTQSIAAAEKKIAHLSTEIEKLAAAKARLTTEIKNLEAEIADNQEALDKATAMRQKELAEFNAEEKDLLQSIAALKSAITVLSKHNSALIQLPDVAASVGDQLRKHEKMLKSVLTRSDRAKLAAYFQVGKDFFDAEPTFKQSYAPQSGEIFGILTQMKETFENNLASSQKEENDAQKAYEELKAAKEKEIKVAQDDVDKKTEELANTDENLANAKQELIDTQESLKADEAFLAMLKEKCGMTDAEWEERQKTRQLEMAAVAKALEILSGDDAHDLFTRTFNPAFVQKSALSKRREAAASVLASVAQKVNSPALSALATRVKLDAFTKVKKAIDDMVAALLQQKEDEIKEKDFCTKTIHENEQAEVSARRDFKDDQKKLKELTEDIKRLEADIKKYKEEIVEFQNQLKKLGEERDAANKEFQQTVADQKATQKILASALKVLKGFYAKKGAASFVQAEPAGPPPPPGFTKYEHNAASGGVMAMIQSIIDDAKTMEKESVRAEQEAQATYEATVADTNKSIEAKEDAITTADETKAAKEADKVRTTEEKEQTLNDLDELAIFDATIHERCDWLLKNFDGRQAARDQEVQALRQAKDILSGANFGL